MRQGPWVRDPRGGTGPAVLCGAQAPSLPGLRRPLASPAGDGCASSGCGQRLQRRPDGRGSGSRRQRDAVRSATSPQPSWPHGARAESCRKAERRRRRGPRGSRGCRRRLLASPCRVARAWVSASQAVFSPDGQNTQEAPALPARGCRCRIPFPVTLRGPSRSGFGLAERSTGQFIRPAPHRCTATGALWMRSLQAPA